MTLVILSSLGKAKEAGTESWAMALWLCSRGQGLELRQREEATGMGSFVIAGTCLLSHSLGLQGQRGCCAVCWNFLGNLSPHL